MHRIIILGNSGSGKSTLAKALAHLYGAEHLDLDTIAWSQEQPTERADGAASQRQLMQFINHHQNWVIEGCYATLLQGVAVYCTELIFLNPGVETCIKNCQSRPWEPHKYPDPETQNANLAMLIDWVRQYETREDEFSLSAHQQLFASHPGRKVEYRANAAIEEELLARQRLGTEPQLEP